MPRMGKRVKGFPLTLTYQHYFMIRQCYPWLQQLGATNEATDMALKLIPVWEITADDVSWAITEGECPTFTYRHGFYGNKTIRVRGDELDGMIRLLRVVGAFTLASGATGTFNRRADLLESISIVDRLADAAR